MKDIKLDKDRPRLSDIEIQKIYAFTTKKYIKYYDVQVELVDHIANKIEDMQASDAGLSFDKALHDVYKGFGVYGFTKVQSKKEQELQSYWAKRMRHHFYRYFKLPKVILTVVLSALIFFVFRYLSVFHQDGIIILIALITICVVSILLSYRLRRERKKTYPDKELLVMHSYETALMGTSSLGNLLPVFWVQFPQFINNNLSIELLGFLSIAFAFMIIVLHASIYVFPQWLEEELAEKYSWIAPQLS